MNRQDASFAERHAVVTGASRGIGSTIAAALAARGARVSLLGRDAEKLNTVAAAIGGTGRATAIVADVTDSASVSAAFNKARETFGPVHILINNAGQAASAKFTDTDEALWHRLLAVNLTGTYLCTRQAVPDMLQLGSGRIVNIASIAGLRGAAYISAYVASKHAVIGLTKTAALEYSSQGIRINAVSPAAIDTEMIDRLAYGMNVKKDDLTTFHPVGRIGRVEEVAEAVLWLCSSKASFVTGHSLVVDGGFTAHTPTYATDRLRKA